MQKHKTGFLVRMLLALVLLLQSCNDTPFIPDLSDDAEIMLPKAITLSNDGKSSEVDVTVSSKDAEWNAVLSDPSIDWCTIFPSSGIGSGKFIVTVAPNENRQARHIDIIVSVGDKQATVTINQKDTLKVGIDDQLIVGNDGDEVKIPVEANTTWEVTQADNRANWIEFSPKHGNGKGEVSLVVSPNKSLNPRNTEIIFAAGNVTRVITILQQKIPEATYKTDSLALVALYNATDGKGWSNPWNTKLPVATWKGVMTELVEGEQRVTVLTLPDRKLDGSVPQELGNLTCLKKLDLSFNAIKGDLPEEIGNLVVLEELNLAHNKFVGNISLSITKLRVLKELDLNNNRFNTFPVELCQMESLESIHVDYNEISSLPGEITTMSNLQILYLDNNLLTALPKGLGKAPKLEFLHAANNQIAGEIPEEIGQMSNLVSLRLENNQFSGSIPSSFSNLTKLENLWLSNNQLSGSLPDLSRLIALETLSVSNNTLSGDIPAFGKVGSLKLADIDLSGNKLTGKLTEDLQNLTELTYLILTDNLLSGDLPAEVLGAETGGAWSDIKNLTNLRFLLLSNNNFTGTIPSGLALRLTSWKSKLNRFALNNNKLSGPVPVSFKDIPLNTFDLSKLLFPQKNGVVLTY